MEVAVGHLMPSRRLSTRRDWIVAVASMAFAVAVLLAGSEAVAQETGDPILTPCHHPCPAEIRFATSYGKLDKLAFHARIMPLGAIDPAAEDVTVGLQNVLGTIAGQTLPAGSIKARENGLYFYSDPTARKTGGIALLKIRPRRDPLGGYRADIIMYGDYSIATVPSMSTVILVGDDLFNNIGDWTSTKTGWIYEFPS
ncbi:MAG: hypothetical protein ACKOCT_04365 [Alphaproteobacteria bacterium]